MMTSHCCHSWYTCLAVHLCMCKRRTSGKLVMKTLRASYAAASGWPADLRTIVEPDPEQLAAPQLLVIKSSASMRFARIYMGSWLVRKVARQSRILRSHSLLGMEGSFGSGVCCRQAG